VPSLFEMAGGGLPQFSSSRRIGGEPLVLLHAQCGWAIASSVRPGGPRESLNHRLPISALGNHAAGFLHVVAWRFISSSTRWIEAEDIEVSRGAHVCPCRREAEHRDRQLLVTRGLVRSEPSGSTRSGDRFGPGPGGCGPCRWRHRGRRARFGSIGHRVRGWRSEGHLHRV